MSYHPRPDVPKTRSATPPAEEKIEFWIIPAMAVLTAVAFFAANSSYNSLAQQEESGTVVAHSVVILLYQLFGKQGVAIFFILVGIIFATLMVILTIGYIQQQIKLRKR
jgi:hypothetical protein